MLLRVLVLQFQREIFDLGVPDSFVGFCLEYIVEIGISNLKYVCRGSTPFTYALPLKQMILITAIFSSIVLLKLSALMQR